MLYQYQRFIPLPLLFLLLFLASPPGQSAQDSTRHSPGIYPGALEIGLATSLTHIKGITTASVDIRSMLFIKGPGKSHWGIGIMGSYTHLLAFQQLDLLATLACWLSFPQTPLQVQFSLNGGIRQEIIGSFKEMSYLSGYSLGTPVMLSQTAALRIDYSYRSVLDDPVANFSEHRFLGGISIFLRNSP